LLNSLNQKLALGHLVEVREQNGVEEAQKPEPVPEPKKRTVAIFKLTEGLGFNETEVYEYTETCAVLGVYAARGANSKPMLRSHVSSFCFDFLALEESYGTQNLWCNTAI